MSGGGRLRDQVAVITGAGGGIGRVIARAFATEGAALVLADVHDAVDAVADDARRSGVRAVALRCDVTRSPDVESLARRAVDELGGLDVLVTCAGIDDPGLLAEQRDLSGLRPGRHGDPDAVDEGGAAAGGRDLRALLQAPGAPPGG